VQHATLLQHKQNNLSKMLYPRLVDTDCSTIPALLHDIDHRLNELGANLYNNVVYMLNQPVPATAIIDLLNYRRILTFKRCNPDYASNYTVEQIASRVKILKFK